MHIRTYAKSTQIRLNETELQTSRNYKFLKRYLSCSIFGTCNLERSSQKVKRWCKQTLTSSFKIKQGNVIHCNISLILELSLLLVSLLKSINSSDKKTSNWSLPVGDDFLFKILPQSKLHLFIGTTELLKLKFSLKMQPSKFDL